MKTRCTRSPRIAAALLRAGGIVAFPTETVYGLGASVFDEHAIRAVFRAKGRPSDNPLIAHIASLDQVPLLAARVPEPARKLMDAFFPGPLTVVVPRHPAVPAAATAGLETIGIRMPALPRTREFLAECAVPVVAPSANRSGRPSPTDWRAVRDDLGGRIDAILTGREAEVGLESTVVDCSGRVPLLLRPGAIGMEALRRVLPDIRRHLPKAGAVVRSPGLRHRHYAPRARVVLVDSVADAVPGPRSAYIGVGGRAARGFHSMMRCRDVAAYAHDVFRFFRDCDSAGITVIHCQRVPESGLGLALMDRLRRAAAR